MKNNNIGIPERQIRAHSTEEYIRVYQAYSDEIADSALKHQKFISPPYNMSRMTWIKPSFYWMMYRSGWGLKDNKQKRILAIDLKHCGFNWALSHSCLSSFKPDLMSSKEDWAKQKASSPVCIQWDPERDFSLNKLGYRSIQIGLSGEAVSRYANDWIVKIVDVTDLASSIKDEVGRGNIDLAKSISPIENPYQVSSFIMDRLFIDKDQI